MRGERGVKDGDGGSGWMCETQQRRFGTMNMLEVNHAPRYAFWNDKEHA